MKYKFQIITLPTLFLLSAILTFCSCNPDPQSRPKERFTDPLYLRQMARKDEKQSTLQGSFFLVMGTIEGSSTEKALVRMMAKVEGDYRFVEIPLEKIRIRIDSACTTPYLQMSYYDDSEHKPAYLIDYDWNVTYYRIVCAEQYLPEKLTPIEIQ